jgi:Xaa-Pro aminopeptidase
VKYTPSVERYTQRRDEFLKQLGDDIAVIPAATETIRNNDVNHHFHQATNFSFLTGFPEPDAVALFDPHHDAPYTLFVRPRDEEMEAWNGRRAGVDGARSQYGADEAYNVDDLARVLRTRLRGHDVVWYSLGSRIDDHVLGALRRARSFRERSGETVPSSLRDPAGILDEMRIVKSSEEIDALREACRLSALGHAEAMRFAAPGVTEGQVQAALEYVWRSQGAPAEGYPSIVASGDNACILHYIENDRTMQDGDLLLIDAAAEVDHLSADVTRTFPVSGSFTAPQRAVYDLVLAAQEAVITACRPGLPFTDMHDIAVRVLTEGMVDLGLLPGPLDDAIAYGWFREFYFHGTGHWLGMDVHDAGTYRVNGAGRPLQPGMAFTVEPGIYVARDKSNVELADVAYDAQAAIELSYLEGAEEARRLNEERKAQAKLRSHDVPVDFLGLGVRIEDDVLVTADGVEILTRDVPVDPDEIEVLAGERSTVPSRI